MDDTTPQQSAPDPAPKARKPRAPGPKPAHDTPTPRAPTPKPRAPAPKPTKPAKEPMKRQLQLRARPELLARARRCAADEDFHGGAPVSLPLLLQKALGTYLAAYEDQLRQAP